MSSRERQLWTEFVRKREERKDERPARKPRAKKPEPTSGCETACRRRPVEDGSGRALASLAAQTKRALQPFGEARIHFLALLPGPFAATLIDGLVWRARKRVEPNSDG
jgi:hypothetical protein